MKRTPKISLAALNQDINYTRPRIEIIAEYTDPIALHEMLLKVLSQPLTLSKLYTEDELQHANPDFLQPEESLLSGYNEFKQMLVAILLSGYRITNILKILDADKEIDTLFGTEHSLNLEQYLATDFTLGIENFGGNFSLSYTVYLFREILMAFSHREHSVAENMNDKGYELAEQERYTEALSYYKQAIEHSPNFHLAWTNYGIALKNTGECLAALECYDYVIEHIDANYKKAWHNKAIALQILGNIDEAMACCNKACEIDPFYEAAIRFKGKLSESG